MAVMSVKYWASFNVRVEVCGWQESIAAEFRDGHSHTVEEWQIAERPIIRSKHASAG
jgi:hypothetical protein